MAFTPRYKPNPRFEQDYLRSGALLPHMKPPAMKVVAAAKALAGREAHQSGDYMRSITMKEDTLEDGTRTYAVGSTDFKANWIEFGTIKHRAKAILRRAAETLGLKVTGGPLG